MKKLLMILLLALLTININCGGGGGSGSSAKTSLVTITVGNSSSGQAMGLLYKQSTPYVGLAAVPSNVYKIDFTIAAPDMPTITKEVLVAEQVSITESFSVPNGDNRYFLVEAKNASGIVLYRGYITVNLFGKPISLIIYMSALDTAPPTVISTSPANSATGVPITSVIIITFSETIDTATFNSSTFTLRNNGNNVAGTITVNGALVTFTPSSNLAYSTTYTGTITTEVEDLVGNAMAADYIWSFTTGAAPDTTPPTVTAVSPGIGATDVPITSTLTATFSEAMNASTINTSTFTLSGSSPVSGTVSYAGTTATFTPSSPLAYNTTYTATITTGVKDLAGNAMAENYTWSFTTRAAFSISPSTVSVAALTNPDGLATDNVTFTISGSGGTPPYNVVSSNTVLIASPGAVAGNVFTVDPDITAATCAGGVVTLTVTDSGSPPQTITATVNVQRSLPSFSPVRSICENDNTCAAGTETLTLTLSGVAPLNITSAIPSVIPSPGSVSSYTYMIDAIDNSIGVDTPVQLTVTDSCGGAPFNAFITVINQGIYVNVNTGYDTTGTGSPSNPYKTITHALSVTLGNEDIYIASGTYDTAAGEVFPLSLKNGTRLIGATTPTKPLITNFGTTRIISGNTTNGVINNLEIYGTTTSGSVLIYAFDPNFSIRNCTIHGDGETFNQGIWVPGSNCSISDSSIYDFGSSGIQVDQSCLIQRNYIYNNNMYGIVTWGNPTIRQNFIYNNDVGIGVTTNATAQPIINYNEIYCNTTADLSIASVVTNQIDARYNAWDNDDPVWVDSSGTCGGGVDVCYTAPGTPAPRTSGNTQKTGGCISPGPG